VALTYNSFLGVLPGKPPWPGSKIVPRTERLWQAAGAQATRLAAGQFKVPLITRLVSPRGLGFRFKLRRICLRHAETISRAGQVPAPNPFLPWEPPLDKSGRLGRTPCASAEQSIRSRRDIVLLITPEVGLRKNDWLEAPTAVLVPGPWIKDTTGLVVFTSFCPG